MIENGRAKALDRDRLTLELRRAGKPFLILMALLVVAVGSGLVILRNNGARLPWEGTYTTSVAVEDVSGLVEKAHDVRLKGVEVGRVGKIRPGAGRAIVEITMDDKYAPIYRNAKLRVRPDTPLKDLYVNIEDRGTPAAGKLGKGDVLSAERTRTAVDIGRVLNVFDADTRDRLEVSIDELGKGLPDHGHDLRAALTELAPFLRAAQRLTRETADRSRRTRRLVHNFRLMTEELGSRDDQLRQVVSAGSASLTEIGSVDGDLERVIADLPPTMSRLQTSLATLDSATDELDPAFTALRPTARSLPAALRSLETLGAKAEPSFRALRKPLPRANRLMRALRPTSDGLATSFQNLRPLAPRFDRITRQIEPCDRELAKFFQNTLSLAKFSDKRAVIFRGQTVLAGGATPQPNQIAGKSCAPGGPGG